MSDTLPPRPTFTNGQYIGADDLNAAVAYARDETQRVALSGRTWGIATGLALIEITDATGAVQLFIEPGIAWDGYGRLVVVLAPAPVTPDLFAGLGSGNQTVWLYYTATATQTIAPGFQTCGTGDPTTRVAESYAITTGSPTPTQRTAGVVINGVTVPDPRDMLIAVDTAAAVVLDGSAAHQSFPPDTAQWLIPVGIAAYVAGSPGSFTARTAAQLALSRAARCYVGTVAEGLLAADGVLRLRDRQTDQQTGLTDDNLAALAAIQTTDIAIDPNNATRLVGNELVWVEGNLRVTGNARLFGTQLELRDSSGQYGQAAANNPNVPEFLRRSLTPPNNTRGGQDLQICIGSASGSPGMDRLTIGVVEALNPANPPSSLSPDGALDERMVIRTDGRVAIGTNTIDNYATIANTLVIATTADTGITVVSSSANTGNLFFAHDTTTRGQNAGFVSYDHAAQELSIGAGSGTVAVATAAGQFVIGPADPTQFDSDADQLIVASNGGPAGLTIAAAQNTYGLIDFANGTVTADAGFIRYDTSPNLMTFGTNGQGQVYVNANGYLGIGTNNPSIQLEIANQTDNHKLLLGLSTIQAMNGGTNSPLLLQQSGSSVGVGLSAPQATLHVHTGGGTSLIVDDANGTTALWAGNGSVGIGGAPRTTFDARGSVAGGGTPTVGNHVAVVENTSAGAANVLALKVDVAGPIPTSCNFITFIDGDNNEIGAVEGYWFSTPSGYSNSVAFNSGAAADYAEAVPRAPGTPPIGPGRVVGVRAGQVSTATDGADAVFVTTDNPAVLGHVPPHDKRGGCEIVAFLGQVGVMVAGPVQPGDLIVASGKADGMGRAVAPASVQNDDLPLIVGRAWQAADGAMPTRINALVGPGVASAVAAASLLSRQASQIEQQSALLARQETAIEAQNALLARQGGEIDQQTTRLAQQAGEVEKLTTTITRQADEIAGQNALLTRQGGEIEQHATRLAQQAGEVEKLTTTITQQGDEIAGQNALLARQGGEIEQQATRIAQQAGEVEKLTTTITRQADEIAGQNALLTRQGGEIEQQATRLAQQGGEVEKLTTTITQQGDEIAGQNALLARQGGEIEQQANRLAQQAGEVEKLTAMIARQANEIAGQNALLARQGGEIKQQTTRIAQQTEQIEKLTTTITQQAGDIAGQNALLASQQDEIGQQTARIAQQAGEIERLTTTLTRQASEIQRLARNKPAGKA